MQRRKERAFWTGEESKNETSAMKKGKRVLDRGRKQERDKCNEERKEIFGQGKKAGTRQVQRRKERAISTGEESNNETSSGGK